MSILQKLILNIDELPVEEVVVGVHSTLVKTENNCGIASTIKYCNPHENIRHAGSLEQMNLHQLAEYALSDNLLESSIGMAAINCACSSMITKYSKINAKDIILQKGRNKSVGIIGHFPFLEQQRNEYQNCFIFEKQPQKDDLREEDIPIFLPKVDVAAITATSITNHTFETIISHLPIHSFNIVLGPSTPLSPILFDFKIDAISGTLIRDYDLVKKYVLQATPTRHLQGIEYVTIFKKDFS